jgi:hypothetical protein
VKVFAVLQVAKIALNRIAQNEFLQKSIWALWLNLRFVNGIQRVKAI